MPDGSIAKNSHPILYKPDNGEVFVRFRPGHVSRKHANQRFILQLYSVKDGRILYQTVPIVVKSKLKPHQLAKSKIGVKRKRSNTLTEENEIKRLRKMVVEQNKRLVEQEKRLNELNKQLQSIVESETVEEKCYEPDLWDPELFLKKDDLNYIDFIF